MPGVLQRLTRRPIADWVCTGEGKGTMWVVDVPDEREPMQEDSDTDGINGEEKKGHEAVRAETGWRPAYCFADTEWLPQDFEIINWRMCRDPKSMFVQNLILIKPLLDEAGERCVGQVTLVKEEFSRKMYDEKGRPGEKEVLLKCKTEEERIGGLEEWFGVRLKPEETRGIVGLGSQIRG